MLTSAWLLLFNSLLLLGRFSTCENMKTIVVATFNAWNIMFNWEVRKFRIAQMIKEVGPDVVAFQELRADNVLDISQLDHLRQLLPAYRWQHFAVAHNVTAMEDTYGTGWAREGIGILSRLPIIRHDVQILSKNSGPDTNQRVALHAYILLDSSYDPATSKTVHVTVVHFSYDRRQQCDNAWEVYQYLNDKQLKNVIMLGDFNSYKDYDDPVKVFTGSSGEISSRKFACPSLLLDSHSGHRPMFSDLWSFVNPNLRGYTFSNMPIPGLESRPDRILLTSADMIPKSANLIGNGSKYKSQFFYHVIWNRIENVLGTSYESYSGYEGRSCHHDCGPHSSCRCGVCVSGGDKRVCRTPDCFECNSTTFSIVLLFSALTFLLMSQLIFAMLLVCLTMNERGSRYRSTESGLPKFCLFDPQLYTDMSVKLRRLKRHRLCKIWPILRLPPMVLVIVTMLMLFVVGEFALYAFKDAINDVYSVIPEELNPSDHLMLYGEVEIRAGER